MIQTFSKSRQQAEAAFGNIQSQLFARNQAGEEINFVEDAQRVKTARLREARLARDAQFESAQRG